MEQLVFHVQGSSAEPYKVVFTRRTNTNLTAHCSCTAGGNGLCCKHRLEIIDGYEKTVRNQNLDDIKTVQSWLIGSDIEKALLRVRELEAEAEKIKKELTLAKTNLAKAMRD